MSAYRFLSTSTVAVAASASNSAARSKYSATLRTLPSSFRGAQSGRLQPLVDMGGGLGLPSLTFEVVPLCAGRQFLSFRAKAFGLLGGHRERTPTCLKRRRCMALLHCGDRAVTGPFCSRFHRLRYFFILFLQRNFSVSVAAAFEFIQAAQRGKIAASTRSLWVHSTFVLTEPSWGTRFVNRKFLVPGTRRRTMQPAIDRVMQTYGAGGRSPGEGL
jgi:hypothetical protein